MISSAVILMFFWGVWIIIPVLFDGLLALTYMLTILVRDRKYRVHKLDEKTLPLVSIVIPTYNEEDNIDECLAFLRSQEYPHEKLEIIVVDNGSTDRTGEIVKSRIDEIHSGKDDFKGVIKLIVRSQKGKAEALNAGIRESQGGIIINIDCRSFLDTHAVYNMVAKFIENPEYGAATGNIEIDWRIIYVRDENGQLVVDENGQYILRELTHKERFLGKGQFLEYLTSFRMGRHFQDLTDTMFTLSGAFSAFRREVLLKSPLYRSRSVSEDTDLTLDLMGQDVRVGFVKDAKAYRRPVLSFEKFFAQRLRWHRGQIEVIGIHLHWYGNKRKNFIRGFWHTLILIKDHTFGFPRIIWTFMIPIFFIFGYSTTLILKAIFLMWAFYFLIDLITAFYCYIVVDQNTREKLKLSFHYAVLTPIFRMIAFYFRFAGYLAVLKEEPTWTTPYNPIKSTKGLLGKVYDRYNSVSQSKALKFLALPVAPRNYDEKFAEIDTYGWDKDEDKPSAEDKHGTD